MLFFTSCTEINCIHLWQLDHKKPYWPQPYVLLFLNLIGLGAWQLICPCVYETICHMKEATMQTYLSTVANQAPQICKWRLLRCSLTIEKQHMTAGIRSKMRIRVSHWIAIWSRFQTSSATRPMSPNLLHRYIGVKKILYDTVCHIDPFSQQCLEESPVTPQLPSRKWHLHLLFTAMAPQILSCFVDVFQQHCCLGPVRAQPTSL